MEMIDHATDMPLWKSIVGGDRGAEAIDAERERKEKTLLDRMDRIEARAFGGISGQAAKTADERLLEKALAEERLKHG
jgi:hypothetical protein